MGASEGNALSRSDRKESGLPVTLARWQWWVRRSAGDRPPIPRRARRGSHFAQPLAVLAGIEPLFATELARCYRELLRLTAGSGKQIG